jgi:acylphosphatase
MASVRPEHNDIPPVIPPGLYRFGAQQSDDWPAMSEAITVRVRIKGRVQGVWYRGWTVDQARRLGLSGWVRNRRDGSVEAVFSGPEPAVRAAIELCREGPPAALVRELTEQIETGPVEPGFRQAPTV